MATQGTSTINFGATPVDEGTFNINDGTLAGLTYAEAFFMRDSTGDNSVDEHESAASNTRLVCSISGTTLTVYINVLHGFLTGNFVIRYVAN